MTLLLNMAHATARIAVALLVAAAPWAATAQTVDKLDRSVLPIAEPQLPVIAAISAPSTESGAVVRLRTGRARWLPPPPARAS